MQPSLSQPGSASGGWHNMLYSAWHPRKLHSPNHFEPCRRPKSPSWNTSQLNVPQTGFKRWRILFMIWFFALTPSFSNSEYLCSLTGVDLMPCFCSRLADVYNLPLDDLASWPTVLASRLSDHGRAYTSQACNDMRLLSYNLRTFVWAYQPSPSSGDSGAFGPSMDVSIPTEDANLRELLKLIVDACKKGRRVDELWYEVRGSSSPCMISSHNVGHSTRISRTSSMRLASWHR